MQKIPKIVQYKSPSVITAKTKYGYKRAPVSMWVIKGSKKGTMKQIPKVPLANTTHCPPPSHVRGVDVSVGPESSPTESGFPKTFFFQRDRLCRRGLLLCVLRLYSAQV